MSKREEWKAHLTPERRQYFEDAGEESVQFDVSNHNYNTQDREFAALYWLGEKRTAREKREKRIFWIVVASLLLTALGVVVAVVNLI